MRRLVAGAVTLIGVLVLIASTAVELGPEPPAAAPEVSVLGTDVSSVTYTEFELTPEPPDAPTTTTIAPPTTTTMQPPQPVTLAFTGDVIAHVDVAKSARTAPGEYDFSPMFDRVAPVLRAADLAICHLEVPLDPDSGTPRGFPRFSSPAEVADALSHAGYDGCSTASNHVLDRGVAGVAETLNVLDEAGLRHTGSARTPEERGGILYTVGDVTIGHASYSYGVSGWLRSDQQWVSNGLDEEQMLLDAAQLKADGADLVVVSVHWGIEHQYRPTSQQVTLGQTLIASDDIDLIVGHHAHVLQPVEVIDGEYVFYGLGNFLSNQEPSCCGEEAQEGAIMLVRVEPSSGTWTISDLRYVPTWVDRHRDYVIHSTLEADVVDHRHAAWLQRSALRVGRDLTLEDAGLSIEQACIWMGTDCAPTVIGTD